MERAIREGFNMLKPGKEFDPLYFSARCRVEADWLVHQSVRIELKSESS